jgi:hypothetical protein
MLISKCSNTLFLSINLTWSLSSTFSSISATHQWYLSKSHKNEYYVFETYAQQVIELSYILRTTYFEPKYDLLICKLIFTWQRNKKNYNHVLGLNIADMNLINFFFNLLERKHESQKLKQNLYPRTSRETDAFSGIGSRITPVAK